MNFFVRNLRQLLKHAPTRKARPRLAIGNLEDRTVPAFFDFSTGMQGWTTGNEAETSLGNLSAASSWAPDAFGNPDNSLGNLNGDGTVNGAENSWIQSPMFTTGGTLTLSFDSWSNNEGGYPTNYDVENVEYSLNGGGVWTPFFTVAQPDLHTAGDSTWRTISYTVPVSSSNEALVRFRIDTGDGNSGGGGASPEGWFIDNVDIKGATFLDENGHLVVSGTDGSDTILIDHGASPSPGSDTLRVFINGRFYGSYTEGIDFDSGIHILAGGSTDTVTLLGTTGADDFEVEDDILTPDQFGDKEFTINGLFISTFEAESYTLKGLDGADTFTINGLGMNSGVTTQNVAIEGGGGADTLQAGPALTSADGDFGGDDVGQLNIEGPGRGNFEGAAVLKFNTIEAFNALSSENFDYVFSPGGSLPGIAGAPGIVSGGGEDYAFFDQLAGPANFSIDSNNLLTSPGGKIANIERIIGTAGLDRLTGATQTTDWTIDGTNNPDEGVYQSGAQPPIEFLSIENLVGGGADDTFDFINDGALSGSIDGGAGIDTISYADFIGLITTSVTPAMTTNVTGTWAKIEAFIGSTDLGNTFTAASTSNTWNLTDVGDGTLNAISFTDYHNLIGGSTTDKFLMGPAAEFTTIAGMNGTDTLNYSGYGVAVTVNLDTNTNGVANGLTTGFTGIDSFVGSADLDTLISTDITDTFVVSTPNTGKLNNVVSFSGFENLDGDLGDDTYKIQSTALNPLASIVDADGLETLVGPNKVNAWTMTGVDTGDLNGTTFSTIENLTGGVSADTFDYSGGGETTGIVNGGSGKDTINFGAGATVDLTSITAGSATGIVGSFLSIEGLVAAGGTLNGADIASTWKLTGSDVGTLNSTTSFNGFSTINGGSAVDRLMLYQGTLTGGFNAGGGTDILDYSGVTTIVRPYKPPILSPSVIDGLGTMIAITGFNKLTGNL